MRRIVEEGKTRIRVEPGVFLASPVQGGSVVLGHAKAEVQEATTTPQEVSQDRLVPVALLLSKELRPRLQAPRRPDSKHSYRNAFNRLVRVYETLYRLGRDGYIGIVPPTDPQELSLDLNEVFKAAYGFDVPHTRKVLVPNFLVVQDHRLRDILRRPHHYFGMRIGEPKPQEPVRKVSPEFVDLQNQVQRAFDFLAGAREDDPVDLLRSLMSAYYRYASKFRGLPRPEAPSGE